MTHTHGCTYICISCERETCRENEPSPGEVDEICASCYLEEEPAC